VALVKPRIVEGGEASIRCIRVLFCQSRKEIPMSFRFNLLLLAVIGVFAASTSCDKNVNSSTARPAVEPFAISGDTVFYKTTLHVNVNGESIQPVSIDFATFDSRWHYRLAEGAVEPNWSVGSVPTQWSFVERLIDFICTGDADTAAVESIFATYGGTIRYKFLNSEFGGYWYTVAFGQEHYVLQVDVPLMEILHPQRADLFAAVFPFGLVNGVYDRPVR
jgi:hypothetical protein